MNIHSVVKTVAAFLQLYSQQGRPLLLALSGGIDSLALFHSLIQCQRKGMPLVFAVAHVDHRWRPTSSDEAAALEQLVVQQGIQWHGHVLEDSISTSNREDDCRRQRLAFFNQLCQSYGYQAVMLAHHADDQAETVLKRALEGANLTALAGISPVSAYGDLTLWRPLLKLPKHILESYLSQTSWKPVDDTSNRDMHYLRARMREQLFPQLSQIFGKEITAPLNQLGAEARELDELLADMCQSEFSSFQYGWLGCYCALNDSKLHLLALRYLLRHLLKCAGCAKLAFAQLDDASRQLKQGSADKRYSKGLSVLYIDRWIAFAVPQYKQTDEIPPSPLVLHPGCYEWDGWTVSVKVTSELSFQTGWRAAWQGHLEYTLPAGNYTLEIPSSGSIAISTGSSLTHLWGNSKVPVWLRKLIPVIMHSKEVAAEFLSGRHRQPFSTNELWLVVLTRTPSTD